MADRDPIERVLGHTVDLYDVAEWDPRTALDRIAVTLYGALHSTRRRLLIAVALLLLVAQLGAAGMLIFDRPALLVLAVISAIPAVVVAGYVWYGDPTRREPLEPLAITFLLAITFSSFAILFNSALQVGFQAIPVVGTALFFFLVVGPIEETVKLLAVRIHAYRTDTFDAVIDGAVYGAVAGLGFAFVENALYIAQGYVQATSAAGVVPFQEAVVTATGRSFVGPGHVLYSALAGYYLGLAKFNPEDAGPIVIKGLLVAALLHATYNTLVSTLPSFIVWTSSTFIAFVVLFDGVVAYILFRKLSRYREYYSRVGDPGAVPEDGR